MKRTLALALLALSACDDGHTRVAVAGQATGGALVYAAPTLISAKRDFFGTVDTGGGSGGGDGVFGDLDGVVMRGSVPSVVAVTTTRTDRVAGIVLRSQLGAEYGELDASLPNGLGILTDPIRVTMWQRAVRAQLTAGQSVDVGRGWQIDYGAGLGWVQYAADGYFRSALLDLRSDSAGGVPYAVLNAGLTPPRWPAMTAGLMVYPNGGTELRLGLEQSF